MKVLNLNSKELHSAASMLKVLGHPIRISIVELLEESTKMSVTEIFKALKIEQAIASHHLNTLKNKRVLISERVGKNTYYSIGHENLTQAVKAVRACQ